MAEYDTDPMRWVMRETFNINVRAGNWAGRVRSCVLRLPDGGARFRRQFATAIVRASLSPAEYHALTEETRYDTPAELAAHLRELWEDLYGPEFTPEDFAE